MHIFSVYSPDANKRVEQAERFYESGDAQINSIQDQEKY